MGYEQIDSIQFYGEEDTIDLEVDHEDHTFFANGISVSNSHAISYAYNSYQCAWLYTYHETEWIKACLECDPSPQEILATVRSLGYTIEKPDINFSAVDEWTIRSDKSCIPALTSLKGLGVVGARELVKNRPPNGFNSLQDVFYDGTHWRYSKFNKKCLTALLRLEGLHNVPDAIGPNGVFRNHAHLENALFGITTRASKAKRGAMVDYKNIDLLKKQTITFEELALDADDTDWTVAERIEQQKKIVGFYDKSLIVGKFLKMFNEFGIDAIDETPDKRPKKGVWMTIDDVTQKKAGNGNPFLVVKASGVTEKEYQFRIWKTSKETTKDWISGNIIIASLDYSGEWGYSVPHNCKITQVEQ